MTKVSIIGLGWLGLPLAYELLKRGYQVQGSTTSPNKIHNLQEKNIKGYLIHLDPLPVQDFEKDIFDTDILFVNIPPRSRSKPSEYHLKQIDYLKEKIQENHIPWVIYVSSTSVYPDTNTIHFEENITEEGIYENSTLYQAERLLNQGKGYDLTIIRFGGLLGADRVPGKYFSGKEKVTGDSPVNYIHQADAAKLAAWVIEKGLKNEIYNGVAPLHPKRKSIYEKNALDLGFPPPVSYSEEGSQWKIISSEKILVTGFRFLFPDPLEFSYTHQ